MHNVISADRAIDEAGGDIPRAHARLMAVAAWNAQGAERIDRAPRARRLRRQGDKERLLAQAAALRAAAADLAAPQEMRMAA